MTEVSTQSMTHINTKVSDASFSNSKRVMLTEQTISSLFANIGYVYRHHFRVIFFCSALPMLPLLLVLELSKRAGPNGPLLAMVPYLMGAFVVSGAMTIVLSDICLGNQPTVRRSYARIFSGNLWWHIFSTSLVYMLAMSLGMLLLILPGLWLLVHGFFIAIIIALEGRFNLDAVRRSIALAKGQAWRIIGLLLPSYLLLMVLSMGVVIVALKLPTMAASVVSLVGNFVVLATVSPAFHLTLVLLYYDQRVRRESYDAQALSEDLMR